MGKITGIFAVTLSTTFAGAKTALCFKGNEVTIGGEFAVVGEPGCISEKTTVYSRGDKSFGTIDFDTYFYPDSDNDASLDMLKGAETATDDLGQNVWIHFELTDRDDTLGTVGMSGTIISIEVKILALMVMLKKEIFHLYNIKTQQVGDRVETPAVAGAAA